MPPREEWESLVPGPETVTWRRGSDARVGTAAGYALLLQVAHPTVGAGVSEHSSFRREPWGRLLRTLDYACTMVYGGARSAGETGIRIRRMHGRIRGVRPDGRPYSALEPDAYAWVHATLAEGIVRAHDLFGERLDEAERAQLWSDWRRLGRLLGIDDEELPPDWPAFRAYFEAMVEQQLEHTRAVDEVLEALARPAPPALSAPGMWFWPAARVPLAHIVRLSTVGLLPPVLRERFGIRWSRRRQAELGALAAALRTATPVMPRALRETGPGYLRVREQAARRARAAGRRRAAAAPPGP